MTGNSLAMLPWFPRDFLTATRAMRLAERGAYCDLLFYQWEMGSLPADAEALARLLGCKAKEFADIWKTVGKKFIQVGDTLHNQRLEEHRAKAIDTRDKKALGAKKTNAKRYGERLGEHIAERLTQRPAERLDIVSPPSPSPSPSLQKPISERHTHSGLSSSLRAENRSDQGSVCGTFKKIGGEKNP